MKPNFDKIREEVDFDEEIVRQIIDSMAESFLTLYKDYSVSLRGDNVVQFITVFHKILNNLALLNIPVELEICRKYYADLDKHKKIYENIEVNKIIDNTLEFFKQLK